MPVLAGDPLGSDIAPFLYILLTSNQPTTRNIMIGTFADDTALVASITDPNIENKNQRNKISVHYFSSST